MQTQRFCIVKASERNSLRVFAQYLTDIMHTLLFTFILQSALIKCTLYSVSFFRVWYCLTFNCFRFAYVSPFDLSLVCARFFSRVIVRFSHSSSWCFVLRCCWCDFPLYCSQSGMTSGWDYLWNHIPLTSPLFIPWNCIPVTYRRYWGKILSVKCFK